MNPSPLLWREGHRLLQLGARAARTAFCLLIYSAVAILAAYVLGSLWGAGNETMRLAAGTAHGSALQERVIEVVAYSSAPTGLVSFFLILFGLRRPGHPDRDDQS